MPKISVIMNCYNGEEFVRQAIESVYAQTFTDWEIVFWDNCSTDRTAEIAQSFDDKLRYFRSETTTPLGTARNLAMGRAKGEWIGFLDHDDLCLPDRFESQVAAIAGGDYALCYAGIREVDAQGRFIRDVLPQHRSGNIFGELLADCDANLQTTMVNRDYMLRYKIETSPSYMLFEDVNLFLKLAAKGPVCVVPEILSVWRLLPTSLSASRRERFAVEYFHLLDELRGENPGIESKYSEAFRVAKARGIYYRARYEMETGNKSAARRSMAEIKSVRPVYGVLYLLSFIPPLWAAAHDRTMKARLTNWFLRRSGAEPRRDDQ
jgi:glycosyltransferase involved in cell wall biosynthesis